MFKYFFTKIESPNKILKSTVSLTKNILCSISDHNLIRKKKIRSKLQEVECKCCDSKLEDSLNANLDTLTDVQLEVKKTIRELFLLHHRRNRQRALARQF